MHNFDVLCSVHTHSFHNAELELVISSILLTRLNFPFYPSIISYTFLMNGVVISVLTLSGMYAFVITRLFANLLLKSIQVLNSIVLEITFSAFMNFFFHFLSFVFHIIAILNSFVPFLRVI